MIYLYVFGGIAAIISGLVIALKIQKAKADSATLQAQAAQDSAKSAEKVIVQQAKTAAALSNADKIINQKHVEQQTKIDAGDRSKFDRSTF